jgi:hypothetical protein
MGAGSAANPAHNGRKGVVEPPSTYRKDDRLGIDSASQTFGERLRVSIAGMSSMVRKHEEVGAHRYLTPPDLRKSHVIDIAT